MSTYQKGCKHSQFHLLCRGPHKLLESHEEDATMGEELSSHGKMVSKLVKVIMHVMHANFPQLHHCKRSEPLRVIYWEMI